MASSRTLHLILFFSSSVFLLAYSVSSYVISNDVLDSHSLTGRSLLQNEELDPCPVDFEKEDYTIITNVCKGPNYSANLCCTGFKRLACPHARELNDLKTDCAFALFDFINYHGHYPLGLFARLCKEGRNGLDCRRYMNVTHRSL